MSVDPTNALHMSRTGDFNAYFDRSRRAAPQSTGMALRANFLVKQPISNGTEV